MLGTPMLGCTERPDVTALLAPDSTSYGPWLKTTEINSGRKGMYSRVLGSLETRQED